MTISRRAFLGGLVATAACSSSSNGSTPTTRRAATSTTATTAPVPDVVLPSDPFTLGVASGDPDDESVVLWTRLLPDAGAVDEDVPVRWDVVDLDGAVVATGEATAEARWGHAVHVTADGLDAATTYHYRFRVGDFVSPEGVTRTAPGGDDEIERVSLAVASCQRYDDGHYAAHRDIAAADVDLVLFLGDYIYESAQRPEAVRPLPSHPEAVVDLAGYRARYEAAHRDADLAAARGAAAPWLVTWDDHEVQNDHTSADVDAARRAAVYQAWWEHQPVRLGPPEGAAIEVHRALRWGSLLDLFLLDTRQHRSAVPCGGGVINTRDCGAVADDARTMLGDAQERWLLDDLAGASATWTVLGQSVVFSSVEILGLVNTDAWDGFPAARQRILDVLPADTVVLTGDIHVQLVADVAAADGTVLASELVTPSVTSSVSPELMPLVQTLPTLARDVRFAEPARRGWLRCDVDTDGWRTTYREVVDITDPASEVVDGAGFTIRRGRPGAIPA